jgi:hypothetical protein
MEAQGICKQEIRSSSVTSSGPLYPGYVDSPDDRVKRQKTSHLTVVAATIPENDEFAQISLVDYDPQEDGGRNHILSVAQQEGPLAVEKKTDDLLNHWVEPEDESDDGSMFEFSGDKGDGRTSGLCPHCQYMVDNWSRYVRDNNIFLFMEDKLEYFSFTHYEDAFQLVASVIHGCALCAQFWRSKSAGDIQFAREEMNKLGRCNYRAPGIRVNRGAFFLTHMEKATTVSWL